MYRYNFYQAVVVIAALLLVNLTGCTDDILRHQTDDTPDFKVTNPRGDLARGVEDVPKMVPFRGSGTWQAVALAPDFENMEIEITVEYEGTATHLGRFEAVWKGRYTFIVVDEMPVPTVYLSHSTTYTAANGDELYDAEDDGTEHFPEEDGLSFLLTGIRIMGGTGRFENAVGSYDLTCIATVGCPFPGGTWEIEGEISSVGSARRGR